MRVGEVLAICGWKKISQYAPSNLVKKLVCLLFIGKDNIYKQFRAPMEINNKLLFNNYLLN